MQRKLFHYAGSGILSIWCGKGSCAQGHIVHVMVESGCEGIADSRIKNLYRLKKEMRLSVSVMMLRLPMMSEIPEVVRWRFSVVSSPKQFVLLTMKVFSKERSSRFAYDRS